MVSARSLSRVAPSLLALALTLEVASPALAQGIDLLFVVDETGTMSAEIAALKQNATTVLVPTAVAALGDVAFGVASYRDFPVSPFGDAGDSPYTLRLSITTNTTAFQVALNSLSAGGGNDIPEASLHALHAAATGSPGWRPGATRVILWIGDAPGHDGDLEPAYASCCSSVGLADAIAALGAEGIAVYAFSADTAYSSLDDTGQASAITAATGGTLSEGLTSTGLLIQALVDVIEGPLAAPNGAPVANAGPDQQGEVGASLTLSGSATDPDEDPIVSWHWEVVSSPPGSAPILETPDDPATLFVADIAGEYQITLVVSDGMLSSQPDTVVVTLVEPAPPGPKIDLLFLVDETGTMSDELLSLKTGGSTLAAVAAAALGDVAFGVARYRDFPVDPYGQPGDIAYELVMPISTSASLFQNALNNLSAGGGGDLPEAGLHALSSVATGSPGWRPDAARVVLWIGDAPSHDGDLEPGYASCCSPVGQADAIAALTAQGIVVYAFSSDATATTLDDAGQATAITGATGGSYAGGLTAGMLVPAIAALLQSLQPHEVPALPLALQLALVVIVAGSASSRLRR